MPELRKPTLLPLAGVLGAALTCTTALAQQPTTAAGADPGAGGPTPVVPSVVLEAAPLPESSPRYESLSLQEAVRRAVSRHPSVAVARQEIARAEALVRAARATSLPTLTGNVMLTRLDDDRVFGNRVVAAANQQSANINLTVPLIAPQRWAAWSRATDSIELARAAEAEVRRQLAVSTARAYLSVISQRRIVQVQERALSTAKAHYDFATAQLQGGVGTRIDQVRAEQEMSVSETQLRNAQAGVARAQEALGLMVGTPGPVDAAQQVVLPETPSTVAAATDDAESVRTDIRAARTRVAITKRSTSRDWTDFMPVLLGSFQPFFQHPSTLTNPETGWQAQLILQVPFYDGGLRYGQQAERAAAAEQAKSQLDWALRQAKAEVRTAFETMRRADQALESARRSAQLSGQALELANIAYKAGATTNLEVIDAERRARDAETAAVVAEDAARQARLDLLAASGRFP